ncbi:MAG: hypothetical protein WB502_02430 [Thermoactinomyces sp.]
MHDFLDLLESDCLIGDEYKELFASFEDMEQAIFAKIVFYEGLRGDISDFQSIIFSRKEWKSHWRKHYIQFLQSLDGVRLNSIGSLISEIDYEDIGGC